MEPNHTPETEQDNNMKEAAPKVMFLEYGEWKKGQHAISAIIKAPGEKRGKVAARIFIEFEGEPKHATYTAKDAEGNILFAPTGKLWELKKSIKENAKPLLEKARLAKSAPTKETSPEKEEQISEKDSPGENGREREIKNTRQKKTGKNKGTELER